MTSLKFNVNGQAVSADVAPRVHLADFLRETRGLTGTHLGCEHGVCGACTVEIDGQIARSCITFAVGCDGAEVRTIEGFDDDPLMARLRAAFTAEHALQCGYCTPGMLIAARDLISRRGRIAEHEIREEMSGNLCRCTGYVGIVRAIERVMAELDDGASAGSSVPSTWLGPLPGPTIKTVLHGVEASAPRVSVQAPRTIVPSAPMRSIAVETSSVRTENGFSRLKQSFVLPHAHDRVWLHMSDLSRTIACVPGAKLDGAPGPDGAFNASMTVALGPIRTVFGGTGTFAADPANYTCTLTGRGRDDRGPSSAQGELVYRLTEAGPDATRVDADIAYALTGPLAQFGRPSLVQSAVSAIASAFASNLEAAIAGRSMAQPATAEPVKGLNAFSLLWTLLVSRLRALFSDRRT